MKLETNSQPVEVVGGSGSSSFSIAMNAKAFRVLSDTLYQNKIGSIVREICCNAYDSHVAANCKDKPFEVHLPDAFEPWFSVKDYGVGLTPEEVRTVLTVYFQSTKDQSNDSIGAFGLGAKTPFSYTDQFTVTSIKNGKKTIYSAFISESGVPDIIEMLSTDTTEPTGVEVKVSVRREDYIKFKSELQSQLRFFNVKPVVNMPVSYDGFTDIVVSNTNLIIGKSKSGYNNIYIVQGNVGYILDQQQLAGKIGNDEMDFIRQVGSFYSIQLNFNIGEIGVTASREGIEYTKNTVKSIESKVSIAMTEVAKLVETEIKGLSSDWERAYYINENKIAKLVPTKFKLGKAAYNIGGMYKFGLYKLVYPENYDPAKHVLDSTLMSISRYHNRKVSIRVGQFVTPTKNPLVIILKDTTKSCNIRIKQFLTNHPATPEVLEYEVHSGVYDQALIDRITEILGGKVTIVRMTDIQLPKKEEKAKTPKKATPDYYAHIGGYEDVRDWYKSESDIEDVEDDVVYVEVEALSVSDDDKSLISKYISLKNIESDLPELIGIRKVKLSKISDKQNFTKLSDFIEEKKKEFDIKKLNIFAEKSAIIKHLMSNVDYHIMNNSEKFSKIAPNNDFTRTVSFIKRNYDKYSTSKDAVKMLKLCNFFGINANMLNTVTTERATKLVSRYKKTIGKFPLMKIYTDYSVRNSFGDKEIAEYLQAMQLFNDSKKGKI